jgi:ADP-ribosylglycohydrolase
MNNKKDKYIASFVLHALGDTIGYNNALWEFNLINDNDMGSSITSILKATIEIISDFVSRGGISMIDLSGWTISDDTLMGYEIGKFILDCDFDKNNVVKEDNIIELKKNIKKMVKKVQQSDIERGFGLMTSNAVLQWNDTTDQRNKPYNVNAGGNGCSMRTLSIGLRFYKDEDIDKLINTSIVTSMITHNSPIGYLAGLASAYFVKLAINNVDINKWVFMLIELYESDKVKKYINKDDDDVFFDYRSTVRIWKKYAEMFFSDKKEKLNLKTSSNLIVRIKTMIELNESIEYNMKRSSYMAGSNGPTSVIMAYDGLCDCNGNWEKLMYYTMLHGGDSDTVGAIAGGLYGIVYGYGNVPMRLLDNLEMKDKLIEIGEKIYDKYS